MEKKTDKTPKNKEPKQRQPEQIDEENPIDLNRLAFLVCRGGWPRATDLEGEIVLEQAFDYYDAIVKSDISRADGVTRNPERVKRLMRSKTAIRTSNTRCFVDSSIAVAALGLGPQDLLADLNTFGLLFETMCIRDLRVFADALNGKCGYRKYRRGISASDSPFL